MIRKWHPREGSSTEITRSGYADADIAPGPAMGSNGMTLARDGRLIVCEPGNRRIVRREKDGSITVLADRYEGRRLNSPNDVVPALRRRALLTDPPHGLLAEDSNPGKELPFNGVFRIRGGGLELLTAVLTRPNGIAFSPDEKFLYVSNSDPTKKIWMRYAVKSDGSFADGVVFLDLTGVHGQAPDGMKVDRDGNLYLSGPGDSGSSTHRPGYSASSAPKESRRTARGGMPTGGRFISQRATKFTGSASRSPEAHTPLRR